MILQVAKRIANIRLTRDSIKNGVWENPKSVLYVGLYTPNPGVPKHSDPIKKTVSFMGQTP